MSVTGIISISITIAGFIFGIITTVAKLSIEYGKMRKELEQNETRDKEERTHTREKFADLYAKIGIHESTLAGLKNNVSNLTTTCERIEAKLDRLIEKETNR
jgi:uncharacterized coiled-coil protein SlyX